MSAWSNATGQEKLNNAAVGLNVDPQLGSAGGGGTIANADQLSTLSAYRIASNSPLIDAGVGLAEFGINVGTQDFFGTTLPQGSGPDIGANEVVPPAADTSAPTASYGAPATIAAGDATASFTVTYTDDTGINASTIDSSDVLVTGPNNFSQLAAFQSIAAGSTATTKVVTYQITGPGGAFDASDNGTYTATMQPSQVFDTSSNPVAVGTLGTFSVSLLAAPPTGVAATDGTYTDKVHVSWNASAGAGSYDVSRSTSNDVSTATFLTNTSTTSIDDSSATAGTTYYYWVKVAQ